MNLKQSLTPEQQVETHKALAYVQYLFVNGLNRYRFVCICLQDYFYGFEPNDPRKDDDGLFDIVQGYIERVYLKDNNTVGDFLGTLNGIDARDVDFEEARRFRLNMLEQLLKELA
jgi:hypothetical protein